MKGMAVNGVSGQKMANFLEEVISPSCQDGYNARPCFLIYPQEILNSDRSILYPEVT